MKKQRIPTSINLPVWMDTAVRDLAEKHKRPLNREIEFLVEEALKNEVIELNPQYADRHPAPMGSLKEAVNG